MSRTVAEAPVDVLEAVGVKQVFGLIGETLNPSGDAVRRSEFRRGRWPAQAPGVLHEAL